MQVEAGLPMIGLTLVVSTPRLLRTDVAELESAIGDAATWYTASAAKWQRNKKDLMMMVAQIKETKEGAKNQRTQRNGKHSKTESCKCWR